MVNPRASSSSSSPSPLLRFRIHTPSSISQCVALLLAFSTVLFFFSQRQIAEVDRNPLSSEESFSVSKEQLWGSSFGYGYYPCVKSTSRYAAPQNWDRYLTVRSNGGLNQMRTGIADMVAVARLMNATLVIPQLDKRSFWQDSSTFADIFDELHFIKSLQGDVRIVQELPRELESAPRARKHFTSWSGVSYYEEMVRLWKEYRKLVERLQSHGRYIALHLRYEKDMLSFTGCTYGLSDMEAEELRIMRENTNHWKLKKIDSTEQRIGGYCPLTPKEVGIFLQALGYPPSTWIYIAAGEIYGGDTYLADLRSRFPNLVFKETLATTKELQNFASHASQTAALDYIISVESDVFVPSYTGNMARAVEGHRRFLGHRKTISPDRRGLVELFDMIERGELKEDEGLQGKGMVLCQEVKAELGLGPKNPSMRTHFLNASASLERIRICIGNSWGWCKDWWCSFYSHSKAQRSVGLPR
uniref:O-fucosyltransferase family protein n=1 Tax=Elaeis guineensis var. tenera TaxID=51953 RepID=A0A6J0PMX5_ELAGV|nr:O-fucosyltransferase 38 isoform X3 [Elaeis guineensis]